MKIQVIRPPSKEEDLASVGQEIYAAADKLGLKLDVEGFLQAWINGLRVIVGRENGEITNLAFLAVGERWHKDDITASLVEIAGERKEEMLEYVHSLCAGLDVTSLFVERINWFPELLQGILKKLGVEDVGIGEIEAALVVTFEEDFPQQGLRGIWEYKF